MVKCHGLTDHLTINPDDLRRLTSNDSAEDKRNTSHLSLIDSKQRRVTV